uniref:Secreted protein n=1 Tax=Ixodes ricinus TaxID=34613 RepID=A0A6B0UUP8_IXORI
MVLTLLLSRFCSISTLPPGPASSASWSALVFLGMRSPMFLVIPWQRTNVLNMSGWMCRRSKESLCRYSGPPQGMLRKTTSPRSRGASSRKSPSTNWILSRTPYTAAFLRASSIFFGSMSTAITRRLTSANWMVLPPAPQKASITMSL